MNLYKERASGCLRTGSLKILVDKQLSLNKALNFFGPVSSFGQMRKAGWGVIHSDWLLPVLKFHHTETGWKHRVTSSQQWQHQDNQTGLAS